jgi:hypothetical protein
MASSGMLHRVALVRVTWRNIPEDAIFYSHRHENLKSYTSTGIFPNRMKYSIITPLHKKGDKNNIANFRPISLLPFFSKIIEKVIYIRD